MSGERANCGDCGKPVLWVATANDKRMPMDANPERGYVLESGTDPMVARQRNVYTCHFDTCKKRKA